MLKDLEKNRSCPTVHALLVKLNLWTNYFIDPPFENSLSISASCVIIHSVMDFLHYWVKLVIYLAKKTYSKVFFPFQKDSNDSGYWKLTWKVRFGPFWRICHIISFECVDFWPNCDPLTLVALISMSTCLFIHKKIPPTCIFLPNKIWNFSTNMHFYL